MLVVSDASPLNFLIRIGEVSVLSVLFERVLIPPAVAAELSHEHTPALVRQWIGRPPAWLAVKQPADAGQTYPVDRGEREAIALAREVHAQALLVDDRKARQTALRLGIPIIGTLGVLQLSAGRGLLDLPESLAKLERTDFIISEELIKQAIERDARRRRDPDA